MVRGLEAGITPVSVRLKNTTRKSKNFEIIRKGERQLLNERLRSISNTIKLKSLQRDTCIGELERGLNNFTFWEYQALMNRVGKLDTAACWNAKQTNLPGYGTKPQVAIQKAEVARTVDTCIHHTLAVQTTHQLTTIHLHLHQ